MFHLWFCLILLDVKKNIYPCQCQCQYKNTLRKTIAQAKKLYYSNQFARHVGNGQKTWQTIDSALLRKPLKSTPDAISIDSKLCTNKKEIANDLIIICNYLCQQ